MSIRNLDYLFRPRSVALVGASDREHTVGAAVMRNLLEGRFAGPVFPMHPARRSVAGVHAYADVRDLPAVPDLAIVCTAADTVPEWVRSLGAAGTRAVAILTDGVEHAALLDAAKPYLMRVLGPNSMGLLVPVLSLNASFAPTAAAHGLLAFVSQSGALLAAALDWAASRRIGFTYAVSLGDSADVDIADVLDFLGSDASTRAVLLYMESLRVGRKFLSAARAVSRSKPVIVMKSGRTSAGAAMVLRRTGAQTSDDAVFDAAIARAGMLRAYTIAELFEAAETLGQMHVTARSKLAVVTNAGGPAVVAVDTALASGAELAGTPDDLGADATVSRYADSLRFALATSPQDTVLLIHAPSALVGAEQVAEGCRVAASRARRVLACWMGGEHAQRGAALLRQSGVPVYATPEAAVQAFVHSRRHARNQEALQEVPPSAVEDFVPDERLAETTIARALDAGRDLLSDGESKALLAAYGIASPSMVRPAGAAHRRAGAQELSLRASEDAAFGMVIRIGKAVGLVPLNRALALDMLDRNDPAAESIAVALARLSQLLAHHPQIVELAIDPLLADDEGVIALEVRVTIAHTAAKPGDHLAIRPYPRELEQRLQLHGLELTLRPIRPGDARAYAEMIAATAAEDLRMRFFTLMRRLPARDLARYAQIDYDRDMTFVAAIGPGATEIAGEVRIFTYPDGETAEFALLVRSDLQRRGIGRALLLKAIDYCRARGTAELIGQIRAENEPMIALARRCGMHVDVAPGTTLAVAHIDLRAPASPDRGLPPPSVVH